CHGGCLKDRLRSPKTTSHTHLCESYRQFFNHADKKLKQASRRVKAHMQKQQARLNAPRPDQSNKIGRNSPCPCGSGRKYKKCCGKSV
ncbi:MAG: anaerobic sulfatase maturase, partial [Desulfobacterales bacterium]|nr:anaerobic sulfatase maturase [Desulfobacterales bacterium]